MPLAPQSKIIIIKRTTMLFNVGLLCSRLYAGHSMLAKKMELGEVVQLGQECAGTEGVCLCVWACGVCGVCGVDHMTQQENLYPQRHWESCNSFPSHGFPLSALPHPTRILLSEISGKQKVSRSANNSIKQLVAGNSPTVCFLPGDSLICPPGCLPTHSTVLLTWRACLHSTQLVCKLRFPHLLTQI